MGQHPVAVIQYTFTQYSTHLRKQIFLLMKIKLFLPAYSQMCSFIWWNFPLVIILCLAFNALLLHCYVCYYSPTFIHSVFCLTTGPKPPLKRFSNIPTKITSHLKFIITCTSLVKIDKSDPFGSTRSLKTEIHSSQYSCINILTINTNKLHFQKNYI